MRRSRQKEKEGESTKETRDDPVQKYLYTRLFSKKQNAEEGGGQPSKNSGNIQDLQTISNDACQYNFG